MRRTRPTRRLLCSGFSQYGNTIDTHSPSSQARNTLVVGHAHLPLVRKVLPGFKEIEADLARQLAEKTSGVAPKLAYAHILRQSPDTTDSTLFSWHKDTECKNQSIYGDLNVESTVIVKLTADKPGEYPSRMKILGAEKMFKCAGHYLITAITLYRHAITAILPRCSQVRTGGRRCRLLPRRCDAQVCPAALAGRTRARQCSPRARTATRARAALPCTIDRLRDVAAQIKIGFFFAEVTERDVRAAKRLRTTEDREWELRK